MDNIAQPTALDFRLHKVFFTPGVDIVTITVQALAGPFRGQLVDLYCSQSALDALRTDTVVPWGDAELLAETARLLAMIGLRFCDAPAVDAGQGFTDTSNREAVPAPDAEP